MKSSVVIAAALAMATNGVTAKLQRCGTNEVPFAFLEESIRLQNIAKHSKPLDDPTPRTQTIKVHMHNIYVNQSTAGAYITEDDIMKQFDVINDNYASTGVSFILGNVTFTENAAWAKSTRGTQNEVKMKKALRQGGYNELNLYFRPIGGNLLGYCTFPEDTKEGSEVFWADGCTVLQSTVPGGATKPYDEGKTATHEIGHWLGLFHTFQGGCRGGDMVDDTPAQETATGGCPEGKDTCRGTEFPGLDPIHNYMDYSDDPCMTEFTAGQAARIYQSWDRYRAPKGASDGSGEGI
ncbi:hypothetical protein H072_10265 [Dactylellina haptotyla CBS 200.50]|uniref:Peptidase M43 pregnancy-associated plasma-A domain-containing protein n=1 Tax=Dactylellina haptotyla (strain CBS 200.50) TaxID=1284197 RepID=S8A4V8_DACHA|nr:hypothetical protein H072_10265 [Dactylellina haptotyla CBS 200.50]